ncbi:hypothetical protein A3J90_00460 [candidate division WOR-1 bacterium RIFOXYC2_FULL_37_10]|uniref:ABC transmembrane type-1 domain-containing protein n=1 Tax=candidate division WOR-1 bacterium RIFOXYB2_FULL_37_13 TaxID=1802579 RepID=A0A1F4SMS6_UNCSA|nr:MAG: hypothetical protein A2246_05315 [candidate division WOR-1 bacterium RIFOXYA2_FULL_37_7]OGC21741.1 MAG: hypothetical protein A2310_00345 [candidate division WOR-1 bacterium RIFOXYB2_FULL_37_13]OGC32602.1 MAG: hypothetical protein A3J90_00460 [candidate division WOR-1 bacterium RIFOXYC2_FULL_37_10]
MRSAKFIIIFSIFIFTVAFFGIIPAVFLDMYRSRVAMGFGSRPSDILPVAIPVVSILIFLPFIISVLKILWTSLVSDQELREKGEYFLMQECP